jgi:thiosulfate dehydrogenase
MPLDTYPWPEVLSGPLIASWTSLETAWDFPLDPETDPRLDGSAEAEAVRRGFRIFTDPPGEAPAYTRGQISCNNCHLNGGQRELALPLVGVAAMFPEYNRRAGREFTLEDRIVGCFYRSQNATGMIPDPALEADYRDVLPDTEAPEVEALAAYLRWLSIGYEPGVSPPWRRQNVIAPENRLPLEDLDRERGEAIFMENCTNCHGEDGQGAAIGDKRPGPLWGAGSWNDGAGAARIYTLAGIIRYAMPYLEPGKLTDEEAQHVSAFINSRQRPSFPFKDQDYLTEEIPIDSVYYPSR